MMEKCRLKTYFFEVIAILKHEQKQIKNEKFEICRRCKDLT